MGHREELTAVCGRILQALRAELCVSMRFLGPSLDALPGRMDLTTRSIGTDAAFLRFNPQYLMQEFVAHPYRLERAILHMLLHCLFRHMYAPQKRGKEGLWDLAADVAAESVLDGLDYDIIRVPLTDFREEWYTRLRGETGVLTAEKVYAWFQNHRQDYDTLEKLSAEFRRCDHSFWARMEEERKDGEPPRSMMMPQKSREDEWKDRAKRAANEIELTGKEAGSGGGGMAELLRFVTEDRPDYREFLRRFAVVREESRVDPDSFDYGYYSYGLSLYGNLPLSEENEFRESRKVEELVIAIDTSASCRAGLVQEFLSETAAVLSGQESYFREVRIHLLECDDRIRADTLFTSPDGLKRAAGEWTVHGGGGTDFRPVFAYVEDLQAKGELRDLRGLMYFTDGFGVYPGKATPYETAFVFRKDREYLDRDVPGWAMKLYI